MKPDHPKKIGNYEVHSVIGKGAMGTVYKASAPPDNEVVAIKVLPEAFKEDPERVERFDREAKAVADLNHPNVVQVLEQGEDDGELFFVMEYVPGSSLAEVMRRRRLSLPETLMVFKQVCSGLAAAHEADVIHRDLNPRNVLVSEDLRVAKIADFGISRVERISRERGTLSTTEVSLGTLHYMAPEQSANMVETDHRSDIYSLGVLLYEMLTGRVPVGRFNLPSRINDDVPPEFDPIVLKCLETDARERYSSVESLVEAVTRLEDQLRLGLVSDLRGIKVSTSKIIVGSTRTLKKRKFIWATVAVLVLLAGATAAVVLLGSRPGTQPPVAEAEPPGEALIVTPTEQYALADESPAGIEFESVPEAPIEEVEDVPIEEEASEEETLEETRATEPKVTPPARSAAAEDLEVIQAKVDTGLLDPALEDLDAFLAGNVPVRHLATARLMKAKVLQMKGQVEGAKAAYVELLTRHGQSAEAAEAGHQLGVLVLASEGRDGLAEAREFFGRVASDHPRSIWAPLSLAAKAEAEKEAKLTVTDSELRTRVPAALATWRSLVADYPRHSRAEQAWLELGEEYEDLKEFEKAAEAYLGLAQHFPSSRLDAWWKAGQIYDRKLDQKEAAREAYLQVPESSRHYRDAQRRLGKL